MLPASFGGSTTAPVRRRLYGAIEVRSLHDVSPRLRSPCMAVAVCVGVLALLTSCGTEQSEPTQNGGSVAATLGPGEKQDLADLAVSAADLPPLRRTVDPLVREDIVAEASLSDLEETLDATGFRLISPIPAPA